MTSDRPRCPVDHHSAEYAANAHELHARFRSETPVGWSEAYGGFWLLSRYSDIKSILKVPSVYSSHRVQNAEGEWRGGAAIPSNTGPLFVPLEIDPPDGLIYRSIIAKWMSRTAIEPLRDRITAYIDQTLDRVEPTGEMDVVTDVGALPAFVVTLILGVDTSLAERIAWPFNAMDTLERDTEEFARARATLGWLIEFLTDTCRARRESPGQDNISELVTAKVDGEYLPLDWCVWTIMTVIGGGVATTTAALSHCLDIIDAHPEVRARLIADPSLLPATIDEALRLKPPVRQLSRLATSDTSVDGVKIAAGEQILASVLSANRDPQAFAHPDEVDIDRPVNNHITFGFGVHRCAGLEVARLDLSLMIGRILERFPEFRVRREECRPFVQAAHNDGYVTFPIDLGPTRKSPAETALAGQAADGGSQA
jgi:cytochrome P450